MASLLDSWSTPSSTPFSYDLGSTPASLVSDPLVSTPASGGLGGLFSGVLSGLTSLAGPALTAYGNLQQGQTQAELAKANAAALIAAQQAKTNQQNTLTSYLPLILGAGAVVAVILGAVFLFKRK